MASRCNPKCIYFPIHSYEKSCKNFSIDKNGIKHNKIKPYCGFDDHLITKWDNCINYIEEYNKRMPNQKPTKTDKVVILMGKSASGKDSILKYLQKEYNFNPIVSYTTRPIRKNEINGKDYYFVQNQDFAKMLKNDEFIETREYNTCFNNKQDTWYYGISKEEFNNKNKKICIVDITGQKEIIKYYGKENVISIYIDVLDDIREKRAKSRGSFSQSEWNRRLKDDNKKFKNVKYDYIISNNGTEKQCQENIENILRKEDLIG